MSQCRNVERVDGDPCPQHLRQREHVDETGRSGRV